MDRRTKRISVLAAATVLSAAAATAVGIQTAPPAAAGTAAKLLEVHAASVKVSDDLWLHDVTEDGSTNFGGSTLFGSSCGAAPIAHAGSYKVMVQDDCRSNPDTLSYRVGTSGAPTTFSDPQIYATSPSDRTLGAVEGPHVAVNSYGLVVETHGVYFEQATGKPALAYTIGTVVGSRILWGTTHTTDRIGAPTAIAINDAFMVEIAYDGVASTSHLAGKVSGGDISWISGGDNTSVGKSASLAMSGSQIVEVYGGSNVDQFGFGEDDGQLFARVGRITTSGVTWQTAHKYDNGYIASVTFDTNGRLVEVHQAGPVDSALWSRTGTVVSVFEAPFLITWSGSSNYDYGAYPQIAG